MEAFASAEDFLQSPARQGAGCLVLDLSMPAMNGFELLEQLRSEACDLPVIVLTAHADEEVRRRSFSMGANAFLAKPFQADALVEAVVERLGHPASLASSTRPR